MRTRILAASIAIAAGSLIAACDNANVAPPAPAPLTTEATEPVSAPVTTSEPVSPPPPSPTTQALPPPPVIPEPVPPPLPPAPPPPAAPPEQPAGAYYKNCDAARAAGVAPLHIGEPGYRPALDRDNDGVACE